MKRYILFFTALMIFSGAIAQRKLRDEHITNQQERMVFKSWSQDKFTPRPGFLGLNPLYWITWGLHPNYPDKDLRPLGPTGPQTSRIALSLAMSAAEQSHKLQSDSIRQTAMENLVGYSSVFADADPLWLLYYSRALSGLKGFEQNSLQGIKADQAAYLQQSGLIDWCRQQHEQLRGRLQVARSANMERGSRMLYYHRILLDYRKLQAAWEDKKRLSERLLKTKSTREKLLKRDKPLRWTQMSDMEIADQVIKNSKL